MSDYKKNKSKYFVEINMSAMGHKGPIVFEKQYSSEIPLDKIIQDTENQIVLEAKQRNLDFGFVYGIYQNIPVTVIERRKIAAGTLTSVIRKKTIEDIK